jgi:uncharacterized protein (TIGR00251 family)
MIALRETAAGVSFSVRVQPRATRAAIMGLMGDALKVAVAASPVEGKANEALIRFFAELFEAPRSSIEIVSGLSSRNKVVRVAGVTADWVRDRLDSFLRKT